MKLITLIRVSFGSAKALTQDGIGGIYQEVEAMDSYQPAAG